MCSSAPVLPAATPAPAQTALSLRLRLRGPALCIGYWEDQFHFSRTGNPSPARQPQIERSEPWVGPELGPSLALPGCPLTLASSRESWSQRARITECGCRAQGHIYSAVGRGSELSKKPWGWGTQPSVSPNERLGPRRGSGDRTQPRPTVMSEVACATYLSQVWLLLKVFCVAAYE